MGRLATLLLCVAPLAALGQQADVPRVQVFAGYSFLRYDSKPIGYSGASYLNGGKLSGAYNLTRYFGVAGEASVDYGTHLDLRDILVGPQFLMPRGRFLYFGHALFGKGRSFDNVGAGTLDTQFTYELGGGVDANLTRRFAVRLVQADYVRTKFFQTQQNDLQVSVGLVYRWRGLKWKPHRVPPPPEPPPAKSK